MRAGLSVSGMLMRGGRMVMAAMLWISLPLFFALFLLASSCWSSSRLFGSVWSSGWGRRGTRMVFGKVMKLRLVGWM